MLLKRFIKRILPAPVFSVLRSVPFRLRDIVVPPPRGEIIPPLRLQHDGPRGYAIFRENGQEALRFYREKVGLQPNSKVLDVGCGIGRKTLPLTHYLTKEALYVGMDIDQNGIEWCSRNITPAFPNFVFFKLDIFNKFYNPGGRIEPSKLVLPFPDNSFDVAALWSVFTHMKPNDVAHYLSELARVLKPGGKLVTSYYLINDHARAAIRSKKAIWPVVHYLKDADCWTVNPNIPEDLIGLAQDQTLAAHERAGLKVDAVLNGGWADRVVEAGMRNLNSQDIILASKV